VKIAAIGDIHCTVNSRGQVREMLRDVDQADVLVLAGDLTDVGKVEEMEVLMEEMADIPIPIVAVPGNHDHEADQLELLVTMLEWSGIRVLDGASCNIDGVEFIGTKGFCGGFGHVRVQPFGEPALKNFINATIEEVMILEKVLKSSHAEHKVAIMHYAPIKETLLGEEPELFPFLGASLFADVLDAHKADVVFHGHAHNGSPHGYTKHNIPVYNVSRFVRARAGMIPPYLVYTI
jgi:Icc-related predicted phosphoesterase